MTNVTSYLIPITLGSALFWATPSVVTQDPGDAFPQDQVSAVDRVVSEWWAHLHNSMPVVAESAQDDPTMTLEQVFAARQEQEQDTAIATARANRAQAAMGLFQDQIVQREVDIATTTTDIATLRAQLEQLRNELQNQPDGPRAADIADRVLSLRDEIASLEVALVDRQAALAALQDQYQRAAIDIDQGRRVLEYQQFQDLKEQQQLYNLLAAQVITAQPQDFEPVNVRRYQTYVAQRQQYDLEGLIAKIAAYEAAIQTLSDAGAAESLADLQRQRDTMRDQVREIKSMRNYDTAEPDDAQLIPLIMSLRDDVQSLRDEVRGLREAIEQTPSYPGISNRTPRHPGAGR